MELLRSGGNALLEVERRLLGDLSWCRRAVHLQCSHGLDALSLLNLGVSEVVGMDLSQAMLAQATRKSTLLDAPATWIHADVLDVPPSLDGSADLVYTGKGALPWVRDLTQWASVVYRILRPDGRLFVFEGHPLTRVWEMEAPTYQLRVDGRGYFDPQPRANDGFPAMAVEQFTPDGEPVAKAWEWQWTLGAIVTAVARAGLIVERLEEHPEHFWPQFDQLKAADAQRLPHTFSLWARRPVV